MLHKSKCTRAEHDYRLIGHVSGLLRNGFIDRCKKCGHTKYPINNLWIIIPFFTLILTCCYGLFRLFKFLF